MIEFLRSHERIKTHTAHYLLLVTTSKFNTIVYPNSSQEPDNGGGTSDVATRVSGGTEPVSRFINPLTLVGFTYGIIFSLPAAAAAVIILYKKGKI